MADSRYVCSRCGYSRTEAEHVIEHIQHRHGGDGRVMETEGDEGEDGWLLGVLRRWYRTYRIMRRRQRR